MEEMRLLGKRTGPSAIALGMSLCFSALSTVFMTPFVAMAQAAAADPQASPPIVSTSNVCNYHVVLSLLHGKP